MASNVRGPKFVQYFQPVIDALVELGGQGKPSELTEPIAENLYISEGEQSEQISSGSSRFSNKVSST